MSRFSGKTIEKIKIRIANISDQNRFAKLNPREISNFRFAKSNPRGNLSSRKSKYFSSVGIVISL